MVSACAYSGAYPTGYGRYRLSTEGVPDPAVRPPASPPASPTSSSPAPARSASTTTTSASPRCSSPLDDARHARGTSRTRSPSPATTPARSSSGIRCELTVGPKSRRAPLHLPRATPTPGSSSTSRSAAWRSTHGAHRADAGPAARGAARRRPGRDRRRGRHRWRCTSSATRPAGARCSGTTGASWRAAAASSSTPSGRTTLRPFGLMLVGPDRGRPDGRAAHRASRCAASSRPRPTSTRTAAAAPAASTRRRADDPTAWRDHLDRVDVDGRDERARTVFATASTTRSIKPCFAPDESPFWPTDGPFVFDICTMWDIYRTQLPLLTTLFPSARSSWRTRCCRSARRRATSRSATAWRAAPTGSSARAAPWRTRSSPTCASSGCPASTGTGRSCHMHDDLRRNYGEDYLERASPTRSRHTLDLAYGYQCTAIVARHVGDDALAGQLDATRRAVDQRVRPGDRAARRLDVLRGRHGGTTRSGCCTTWPPGSSSPAATSAFTDMLDRVLRVRRRAGEAARRAAVRHDELAAGLRAQPLRGPQQRTRHGGALGVPLRRVGPTAPPRSCTPRSPTSSAPAGAGCPATTTPVGSAPGTCGPRSGCSRSPARACSWSTPRRSAGTTSCRRRRRSSIETPGFAPPRPEGDRAAVRAVGRRSTASRSNARWLTGTRAARRRPPARRARPRALRAGDDERRPSISGRIRPPQLRQRTDDVRHRRTPDRRLVIVVRADPVICGHSGEARNLAEVAAHARLRRRPHRDLADRRRCRPRGCR